MRVIFVLLVIFLLEPVFGMRGFQQLAMQKMRARSMDEADYDSNDDSYTRNLAYSHRRRGQSDDDFDEEVEEIKVKPWRERVRKLNGPGAGSGKGSSGGYGAGIGGGFGAGMNGYGMGMGMGMGMGGSYGASFNNPMDVYSSRMLQNQMEMAQMNPMMGGPGMMGFGQMGQFGPMAQYSQNPYQNLMNNPMGFHNPAMMNPMASQMGLNPALMGGMQQPQRKRFLESKRFALKTPEEIEEEKNKGREVKLSRSQSKKAKKEEEQLEEPELDENEEEVDEEEEEETKPVRKTQTKEKMKALSSPSKNVKTKNLMFMIDQPEQLNQQDSERITMLAKNDNTEQAIKS